MRNVFGKQNYKNDIKRWGGFRQTLDDSEIKEKPGVELMLIVSVIWNTKTWIQKHKP